MVSRQLAIAYAIKFSSTSNTLMAGIPHRSLRAENSWRQKWTRFNLMVCMRFLRARDRENVKRWFGTTST
jgi:hypothetical protein